MGKDDLEVRAVSKEELKAGVTVQAGHLVTFVVGGLKGKGKPRPAPPQDGKRRRS